MLFLLFISFICPKKIQSNQNNLANNIFLIEYINSVDDDNNKFNDKYQGIQSSRSNKNTNEGKFNSNHIPETVNHISKISLLDKNNRYKKNNFVYKKDINNYIHKSAISENAYDESDKQDEEISAWEKWKDRVASKKQVPLSPTPISNTNSRHNENSPFENNNIYNQQKKEEKYENPAWKRLTKPTKTPIPEDNDDDEDEIPAWIRFRKPTKTPVPEEKDDDYEYEIPAWRRFIKPTKTPIPEDKYADDDDDYEIPAWRKFIKPTRTPKPEDKNDYEIPAWRRFIKPTRTPEPDDEDDLRNWWRKAKPTATPIPEKNKEEPTLPPSPSKSKIPSKTPSATPMATPTRSPTKTPTRSPTKTPTKTPTRSPTKTPTRSPTQSPKPSKSNLPSATKFVENDRGKERENNDVQKNEKDSRSNTNNENHTDGHLNGFANKTKRPSGLNAPEVIIIISMLGAALAVLFLGGTYYFFGGHSIVSGRDNESLMNNGYY